MNIKKSRLIFILPMVLVVCAAFFVSGIVLSEEVAVAADMPSFSVQPADVTISYGETAVLYAEANSADATYSWYDNYDNTFLQEGRELVLYGLTTADSGREFYCRANFANGQNIKSEVVTVTVLKRTVYVKVQSVRIEYGQPETVPLYELESGSTLAEGDTLEALNIRLVREGGSDAGRYAVNGTYDNDDYNVIFRAATYTIEPKVLDFRLVCEGGFVYDGYEKKISCEIIAENPPEIETVVTFNRFVKDAGTYTSYVHSLNPNYAFYNGGEKVFTVAKAPLTVKLDDLVYKKGETPLPTFTYSGFLAEDDEDDLEVKPSMAIVPQEVGSYNVLPEGASDDNYEFLYKEGKVSVNYPSLSANGSSVVGSFPAGSVLTVTSNGCDEALEAIASITKIVNDYVKIDLGDKETGEYSAVIDGIKKPMPFLLRACIVDENGDKHTLSDFEYKDGKFYYSADTDGVLIIYYDIVIPIIVGSILLLTVIIIIALVVKDRKKHRIYAQRAYIARKIADDEVAGHRPDVDWGDGSEKWRE